MTPRYLIREGQDADIEQCVALALVAAPEPGPSEWNDSLARDIEKPEHHLVVAELAGAVSSPYNTQRPHRALELRPPKPDERGEELSQGDVRRRDRLGGLIHEYYKAAA